MRTQRVFAAVGAAGSVAAVLWVGRRNPSLLLIAMFLVWVLLPFFGALYARLAPLVSLGSLAVFGYVALGPPQAQVAKWFLLTPVVWWVAIFAVIAFRRFSGKT